MTRIEEARIAKGISKVKLARVAGIARSYLYEIESGNKSPTLRTLKRLADALGVEVRNLLEDEAQ